MPQFKSIAIGPSADRNAGRRSHDNVPILFHCDEAVATDRLRELARDEVRNSSLICRAAAGDRCAAVALHIGFWPFVSEFEVAIDRHQLPRSPLRVRYSDRVKSIFPKIAAAIRAMQLEEGSHAEHWRECAKQIGIYELAAPVAPKVNALIMSAYTDLLPDFFAVLAGTELIAEELSEFLVASPRFTEQFTRKRWTWGDIHLLPHDNGPSHLEIDLDLARAYSPDGDIQPIERVVADTIHSFGCAAREVEQVVIPSAMLAQVATVQT